jgi:hypothetical protein
MRKSFASVTRNKALGKLLSGVVLLSLALSSFGVGSVRGEQTQPLATNLLQQNPGQLVLPDLKLPYSKDATVYWTGGPHGYNQGGVFTGTYTAGEGSGLDFSMNDSPFEVLAMASGTVIEATCEGYGSLGCIVAIKHDVGGTVLVWADENQCCLGDFRLHNWCHFCSSLSRRQFACRGRLCYSVITLTHWRRDDKERHKGQGLQKPREKAGPLF